MKNHVKKHLKKQDVTKENLENAFIFNKINSQTDMKINYLLNDKIDDSVDTNFHSALYSNLNSASCTPSNPNKITEENLIINQKHLFIDLSVNNYLSRSGDMNLEKDSKIEICKNFNNDSFSLSFSKAFQNYDQENNNLYNIEHTELINYNIDLFDIDSEEWYINI